MEDKKIEERNIIEAILFMSSKPLTIYEISEVSGIASIGYVKQLLEAKTKICFR